MNIKVKVEFHDKFNYGITYHLGKVYDFEEERAEDIIRRGLGELAEAPKEESKVEAPVEEAPKEEKPAAPKAKKGTKKKAE